MAIPADMDGLLSCHGRAFLQSGHLLLCAVIFIIRPEPMLTHVMIFEFYKHSYATIVVYCALWYILIMIKSFPHKGLKKFFDPGSVAGIQPRHARRLRMRLVALDTAITIDDMYIPGVKSHSLRGSDNDRWSVWVNGNWRVTFEFRDGHAFVLDYEDYH